MKAIINARFVTNGQIIDDKVLLFDEKIIGFFDSVPQEGKPETIDAGGAYVSAGFIDLHIHGSGGADVMDATPQALQTLSRILPQTGTTSFLATTMTMSADMIEKALQNIRTHANEVTGAQILGVHLEGPFINPDRHGAQDRAFVQPPDISLVAKYNDIIRMVTLAPEMPDAKAMIERIKKEYPHILLSAGHSDATYAEAMESFGWGVSHVTHLFNAMSGLHHRKPGLVGAVFESDVSCDIIADLVHTHPATLALTQRLKKGALILITDAMRAGCMRCGSYDLGGRYVEVQEGKAVLGDGTLAGSVLKMHEALRNMSEHTAATLPELIDMVTTLPAQKLGVQKGVLQEGYDADITIFDENFDIMLTIINGKINFQG
ncbi:MAG: N-acetylglucosamine-6-phosphate deacetylase [Sulfurovum sp.]|nr:MAG: N-acetylglucosamine-6-phosphate deacetylase [Sulfurovum sp.]